MRLLDEGEVAQVLKCTKAALRRWRREGRGPCYVRLGRLIRYRQDDIMAFIEENAVDRVRPKGDILQISLDKTNTLG